MIARRDQSYLDDRSDKTQLLYYVAKIHVSSQTIDSVACRVLPICVNRTVISIPTVNRIRCTPGSEAMSGTTQNEHAALDQRG